MVCVWVLLKLKGQNHGAHQLLTCCQSLKLTKVNIVWDACLSVSLSLTQTHTHTYTNTQMKIADHEKLHNACQDYGLIENAFLRVCGGCC